MKKLKDSKFTSKCRKYSLQQKIHWQNDVCKEIINCGIHVIINAKRHHIYHNQQYQLSLGQQTR